MLNLRFAGGIALLTATVISCGAATTSLAAEERVPAEPTLVDYVDPAGVAGLSTRIITESDESGRRVHAAYPVVEDAPELADRLREVVTGRLELFERNALAASPAAVPEFNADWQLSAASDQVVGVRLSIGELSQAGWVNSRTTVWYDRAEGRAVDSTGLLKDGDALASLAALTRQGLAGKTGVDAGAVTADERFFDSLAFNSRGELVVEFDDYQVAAGSLGRVAVAVPARKATDLLSPTGLRAQRAATAIKSTPPLPTSEAVLKAAASGRPPAVSVEAGTVDCARAKCVALTYEDGPGPETGALLDVLAEHDARATFFTVGMSAVAQPGLLRSMSAQGHLVAGHTWSHRSLTSLPTSKIANQFTRGRDAVGQAIGQDPALVRPPYGATGSEVVETARGLGLSLVGWDVDAGDLGTEDAEEVSRRVVSQARPGAIIRMHDTSPAGVEATPAILRDLKEQGYTFVTVPELYGPAGMRPGQVYASAPAPAR
ncbi:polysaccharide deacetylase family protein [Planobispora takensis]|uniref:NodB homology domain-containing protein n=1 Tax=Planobispora takensis TaxID=1367882 RepID=A0A8J3WV67_9ACTN|nr:polysaccharide deacetylase family protein [Planobispora takensis]GII02363.1 hypothetical protein Pta02_43710 [Planobispora takensis]